MSAEYYLELRDFATGTRTAILTGMTGSGAGARSGFLRLSCRQQVNAPGLLRVEVPADAPFLSGLADKTQVLLKRRDVAHGITWYTEFVALYRDMEYASSRGRCTSTLVCPGLMSILDWYHVLWPANVASRTAWTGARAESIAKTLVSYNAVAATATTTNGRDRNAPNYGVQIQADAAGGNTIDWTAGRNKTLLAELQALATVAGGDVDLVYASGTAREFRFYAGQRGGDRTATVTFAEHLGNMDNVKWTRKRSAERTVALVAGAGQESARTTTVRTGINYSASNDIETFVDAKDLAANDSPAARSARGDKRLDEMESRDEFWFDVVQTEGLYYRGSYVLGDLVTVIRPDGTSVTQQVCGIDMDYTPSDGERIGVEVRT